MWLRCLALVAASLLPACIEEGSASPGLAEIRPTPFLALLPTPVPQPTATPQPLAPCPEPERGARPGAAVTVAGRRLEVAPHPRLLFSDDDIPSILCNARSGAGAAQLARLRTYAEQIARAPATGAPRVADAWWHVDRVLALGLAYRLFGDPRLGERGKAELLTLVSIPDWRDTPALRADLMTGQVASGVGLGYDWLYDALDEGERAAVRDGLVARGLRPYLQGVSGRGDWWRDNAANWNAVVNGGVGVGALGVLGEAPEGAATVEAAQRYIRSFFRAMPDDGGSEEGSAYWFFGMQYAGRFVAALESALGTDLGLGETPGFAETAWMPVYMRLPDGASPKIGDDGPQSTPVFGEEWTNPIMHFFARRYGRPEFAWARDGTRSARGWSEYWYLDLLWRDERFASYTPEVLPPSRVFQGIGWASLRTGWDRGAKAVVIKAGDTGASHAHLDLASFVYVWGSTRFLIDPSRPAGPVGSYPEGYFSARDRGTRFYHLSTRAHNTLLVDGGGQVWGSKASIVQADLTPEADYVVVDASRAYGPKVSRFVRHFLFHRPTGVLAILDDVAASGDVVALFHTFRPAAPEGSGATLRGNAGNLLLATPLGDRGPMAAEPREAEDVVLKVRVDPNGPSLHLLIPLGDSARATYEVQEAGGDARTVSLTIDGRLVLRLSLSKEGGRWRLSGGE